jgi:4-amino-4-deoxy-L-arabinose transferase-like glycosyltransferase
MILAPRVIRWLRLERPADPPRGLDGLPVAGPLETRASRIVAAIASVWFALAASWELFGPMLAGHVASSASVGIMAENMIRWHIAGPVWEYTAARPPPSMYYCHHPWGIFWTTAALMEVFGRHDFICKLAPVLLSVITPPTLYALGRAIWRPAAGAAAAASFVVLPICLAFANFNALEVPVMAWSLLGSLGLVRLTQTGRRRWIALAVVGLLLALHADWPAYVFVGTVLGFGLLRAVLAPRLFGRMTHPRRYLQLWALAAAGSGLTAFLYLVLFREAGKLDDLLGAYGQRSSGSNIPLRAVLDSRRYWIELCFTPIAIALGKAAAVVIALRVVLLRREHEVLALAVLLMATVQYVLFKQGADIHIFWPHYYAAYFALAMGALVATIVPLAERIPPLRGGELAPRAALGLAILPLLAIARDGVPALRYAHDTGGRFNEKGLLIHTDAAKTTFLRFVAGGIPKSFTVAMHDGMKATWSQVWSLGGRILADHRPTPGKGPGVWLADSRFLPNEAQGSIAQASHVTAVGPFWKVLEGDRPGPIDAYSFVETEPPLWEWYLVSGTEPHREVAPDPWLTWELRTHFGQPADPPSGTPATLDQRRIAHNVALASGDTAKAAEILAGIERELTPVHAAYEDGTEILGTVFHEGARPLLTILVKAGGPQAADVQLHVTSKVTAKAAWSLTMADPTEREVGIPLGLPPARWRKGFLYADPVAIRKRPGREVYRATFSGRGGGGSRRVNGPRDVELLTLR